jgi:hypothetical protein
LVVARVDAVFEASRALDRVRESKTPLPGMQAFLNKLADSLPHSGAWSPE